MKKCILFYTLSVCLCSVIRLPAQTWQWAAGSKGGSEGFGAATDPFGNVVMCGFSQSTSITLGSVTFTLPGLGSESSLVAKYDAYGNFLWAQAAISPLGSSAVPLGITSDQLGNTYLLGYYNGPTLTAGAITLSNPASPGGATFLIKYTPAGSIAFARNFMNTAFGASNNYTNAAIKAKGTHIYIAATYAPATVSIGGHTIANSGPAGSTSDVLVCKLDTLGNVAWLKDFGGSGIEQVISMDVTPREEVYIAGMFWSPTISFGAGSISNTGIRSLYLAKFDSSGSPMWARAAGGNSEEMGAVATDTAGNAYITGSYNYPVSFGPYTLTNPSPGSNLSYLFVARYDALGNVVWAKSIKETGLWNYAAAAVTDACGNLWMTGTMGAAGTPAGTGPVTFDGHVLNVPAGSADPAFLAEYDASGTYLFSTAVQTLGDDISNLSIDAYNNLFVAGDYFISTLTLGSSTLHDPSGHPENMCVAKYGRPLSALDTVYLHSDTCINGSITLAAPPGYQYYRWYDGDISSTKTIGTAGKYWVQAFGSCSADVLIDTFNVSIGTTDTIRHSSDTTLCAASTVMLTGPPGYSSYLWNNGSTGSSVSASFGTWWLVCKGACTEPIVIDTFKIAVNTTNLYFSLGGDTTACAPLLLQVPVTGGAYLWQDGSTAPTFLATHTGAYHATVTEQGCSFSDTINVTVADLTQHLRDTTVCSEQPIQLTLHANVPPGGTALWSNGSTQSSVNATDTGRYWVTVSAAGCTQSDSMTLKSQLCYCNAALPSAFTPNEDGTNDYYYPIIDPACNVDNYSFAIYNRWGQQVFMARSLNEKWDGYFNGSPAEMGVYMYYLEYYAGLLHTKHTYKGDVTLIR